MKNIYNFGQAIIQLEDPQKRETYPAKLWSWVGPASLCIRLFEDF